MQSARITTAPDPPPASSAAPPPASARRRWRRCSIRGCSRRRGGGSIPRGGAAGRARTPHFAAKAKRVIYLFMSGGPSHIDLFDYKPKLKEHHGTELPASVRMGQRITGMTAGQKSFPVRRADVQVRAARPVRRLGQRAAAAHGGDRRRHRHRQVAATPRRSTTTRRSRSSRPATSSRAGRASGPG